MPMEKSLQAKIQRLFRKDVRANDRLQRYLDNDYTAAKKITLLQDLRNGLTDTADIIHIIKEQISYYTKQKRLRRKTLKIDSKLKEVILIQHLLISEEGKITDAILQRAAKEARSKPDEDALTIFKDLVKTTIEREKINNEWVGIEQDAIELNTKELLHISTYLLNLDKQLKLVNLLKSTKGKEPKTIRYENGNVLEKLETLLEEEESLHAIVVREEKLLISLEKNMLSRFAADYFQRERIKQMKTGLISAAAVGSVSALLVLAANFYVERAAQKYDPRIKPADVMAKLESSFRGKTWEQMIRTFPDKRVKAAIEALRKKSDKPFTTKQATDAVIQDIANFAADNFVKTMPTIKGVEVLDRWGLGIDYFKANKPVMVEKAVQAVSRNAIYRKIIDEKVEKLTKTKSKNRLQWLQQTFDPRPGYVERNQTKDMQKVVEAFEDLKAELFNLMVIEMKAAIPELVVGVGEEIAPSFAQKYVRPFVDLLIQYWMSSILIALLASMASGAAVGSIFWFGKKQTLRDGFKRELLKVAKNIRIAQVQSRNRIKKT